MSGFSTSRFGLDSIVKQYGSILHGYGPPVPKAGVIGDLYIDAMTFQMFEKRTHGLDDWGHYLFIVPSPYSNNLKWFGPSAPSNTVGITGDYFMHWAGYDNYGMQLTIWGPKAITGWTENGEGPDSPIVADSIRPLGLLDEGPLRKDMKPTQLIAVGLFDEYIIPLTVTSNQNDLVSQSGLQNTGKLVMVTINPLYAAEDTHAL